MTGIATFLDCDSSGALGQLSDVEHEIRVFSFMEPGAMRSPRNTAAEVVRMASHYIVARRTIARGLCLGGKPYVPEGVRMRDLGIVPRPTGDTSLREAQEGIFGRIRTGGRVDGLAIGILGSDLENFFCLVGREGTVVHIDAHSDEGQDDDFLHHGNFMALLRKHSPKLKILHVGNRELLPASLGYPQRDVASDNELNLKEIDRTLPLYVAVDMDILDPCRFPHVTCPVPEGWEVEKLVRIIKALAAMPNFRYLSFSEFMPPPSQKDALLGGLLVARLVVHAVASWKQHA